MLYDRKIKYLDYCEHGERIRGAGFLKLEVREGKLRMELSVTGLYPTDAFERDILLQGEREEGVLGRIVLSAGGGEFRQSFDDLEHIGRTGIPYDQARGLRIPLGAGREISCSWKGSNEIGKVRGSKAAEKETAEGRGRIERDEKRKRPEGTVSARRQADIGAEESESRKWESTRESEVRGGESTRESKSRRGENAGDSGGRGEESIGESKGRRGENAGKSGGRGGESIGESGGRRGENAGDSGGRGGESIGESGGRRGENAGDSGGRGGESARESKSRRGENAGESGGRGGESARESKSRRGENAGDSGDRGAGGRMADKWNGDRGAGRRPRVNEADRWNRADGANGLTEPARMVGWAKTGGGDRAAELEETSGNGGMGRMADADGASRGANVAETGAKDSRGGRRNLQKEEKPARLMDDKWQQLYAIYPHIHPFNDEREYISIRPADFVVFPSDSYKAANNSFLLHGYYNYKHLILTRVERKGELRYYIGVPGNYYEREKQVAIMFGFESFECAEEPAQAGDFGYYMMRTEL